MPYLLLLIPLLAALLYWLLVITEGVYLGRRFVVWLYDLTAHKYDGIKGYEAEAEELFVVRPLLHRLRGVPAPRLLDVATGTGRVPWFVLQQPTFHGRFTALDASRRMLSHAAEKLRPLRRRCSLVQGTAVPLPFPAASFDGVICLESLEFFPSDAAALREMVRVLRPGGVLLVTRRRGWEAQTFLGRHRTPAQFETLLQNLGLEEIETRPWQVNYDQVFARRPENK
ncbi:MAG: class I SAM-dependent methyltransferase [Anaerolineales bacterium]|nr:class I SAM-dependent methyltransferase [Anaerolineales bacterium]